MLFRQFLAAVILLPLAAHAQFSLEATQVGLTGPDAQSHAGICAQDACRAIVPIRLNGDTCALNIRVGAPTREGWGRVVFAVGPCQSRVKLAVSPDVVEIGDTLDRFFAASQTFVLPLQIATDSAPNKILDDGVLHQPVVMRLDIIANKPR